MKTCKNCIHYDACYEFSRSLKQLAKHNFEGKCLHFKDVDDYIYIPMCSYADLIRKVKKTNAKEKAED